MKFVTQIAALLVLIPSATVHSGVQSKALKQAVAKIYECGTFQVAIETMLKHRLRKDRKDFARMLQIRGVESLPYLRVLGPRMAISHQNTRADFTIRNLDDGVFALGDVIFNTSPNNSLVESFDHLDDRVRGLVEGTRRKGGRPDWHEATIMGAAILLADYLRHTHPK